MTLRDDIVAQLQQQASTLSPEKLDQLAEKILSQIGEHDRLQTLPAHDLLPKLPPTIQVMLAQDHSSIENAAQYAVQVLLAQVDSDNQAVVPAAYRASDYCPFPGLSAFDDGMARYYFGREDEIELFLSRLKAPITAITGPSGVGKSSFLQAGILPRLKAKTGKKEDPFLVFRDFEGSNFLLTFASALEVADPEKMIQIMGQKVTGLAEALWSDYGSQGHHVTLILDQFESLFVKDDPARVAERDIFLDNLLAINSQDASTNITVIIVTRENFYEHPAFLARPGLDEIVRQNAFVLRPLDATQLRQAMEGPLTRFNDQFGTTLRFENNLTTVIANAFKHDAAHSLPLVQYLLRLMWIEKQALTYQAYFGLGQLDRALDRHANDIFQTLPDEDKPLAKALLLAMVRPGISGRYARKRVPAAKFLTGKSVRERHLFESILGRFTNAQSRLISTQSVGNVVFYELTHDILLEQWSTLTTLIEANQARLALRESLLPKAEAWWRSRQTNGSDGDRGELFVGNELQRAVEYLHQEQSPEGLDSTIAACYEASRRYRRRRIVRNSLIALLLVLGFVATVLFLQSQTNEQGERAEQAEAQVDVAETENAMTQATATRQRQDSAATEAALATEQVADRATLAARSTAQVVAVATADAQATLRAQAEADLNVEATRRAEAEASQAAEAEINSSLELIAEANRLLQQPDGDTELAVLLTLHALANVSSNEGQTALATGLSRLRTLLSLNDAVPPDALANDRTEAAIEVSSDGRLLAYQAWQDNTVRVHDANSGNLLWTLTGHRALVSSMTFTQDGTRLISAGHDGQVILWELVADGTVRTLFSIQSQLTAVDLDREETTLLVGDSVGRLYTLPFSGGEAETLLTDFEGEISDAKFTLDGENILIALTDTPRIALWSLERQEAIYTRRVPWPLFSFSYSPDGSEFVGSVLGNQVEVRTVADGESRLQIPLDSIIALARFSEDGEQIVTASSALPLTESSQLGRSSLIEFWQSDNGSRGSSFRGHNSITIGMALLQNDARLAAVGLDGSVRILSAEPILNPSGSIQLRDPHPFGMWGHDLSPDGQYLLSTGTVFNLLGTATPNQAAADEEPNPFRDNRIGILDAHSGDLLSELSLPETILAGQFSPDGKQVLILSEADEGGGRIATLWEWTTDNILVAYPAYPGAQSGWFLPGGGLLSHQADGTVAFNNLSENDDAILFAVEEDPLQAAQVLPVEGTEMILTVSIDHQVQLWDAPSGSLLREEAIQLDGAVTGVDFSQNGRYAVLVHARKAAVVDMESMEVAYTFEDVDSDDVVGFSAAGAYKIHIASRLLISDIEMETWLPGYLSANKITIEHDLVFQDALLTPDGKTVVAASGPLSNTITGWDAETGENLYTFEQSDIGSSLLLSPDGHLFTQNVLSVNARIPVWEARSGNLIRTLELAENGLFNVVFLFFSESGGQLVTIHLPLANFEQAEAYSSGEEFSVGDLRTVGELWYLDYQGLACGMVFRPLTEFEKSQYGITEPEPICP